MKKFYILLLFISGLSREAIGQSFSMSNGTITTCSGTFYDSGGSGGNYAINESYTETFTGSSGSCIIATFTAFDTQSGNDVLTIYDGPGTTSPVIGNFSGNTSPGTIISSAGSITFKFVSGSLNNHSGWAASLSCGTCATTYLISTASSTTTTCTGLMYDSGGAGNYSNNESYTKTFCATAGSCMQVNWYSFSLGSGDTLRIYDGSSTAATLIGKYYGTSSTTAPHSLLSSTGCITFYFTSNNISVSSGWKCDLNCSTCPTSPASTATYTHPTTGQQSTYAGSNMVNTCGGTFSDNGNIGATTSFNYSNGIGDIFGGIYRTFCPNVANKCLRVNFSSLGVVYPDLLTIINGPTQGNSTFGSYSGTLTSYQNCMGVGFGPFTSTDQSGCLGFSFYSTSFTTSSGWVATFDCVTCASGPNGIDNNDCTRATSLCTNTSFSDASTGPGLVSEGGSGCNIAENYPNWYKIEIFSSGTLGLTIIPVSSTDDYDFVLYGPSTTCAALGNPIRCSYAENVGNTGMGNSASDVSEDVTGDAWVSTLGVTATQTYYLMINKWSAGGNGFTLNWNLSPGTSLDCNLLPVELTDFTCSSENNIIMLDWATASEYNNKYFLVERSNDGENYEKFIYVDGKGYATSETRYFLVDEHPLPGTNYYRLSQIDFDGSQRLLKETACKIALDDDPLTLHVYDLSGRILYTEKTIRSSVEKLLHEIPLIPGVYVISIRYQNGGTELSKFLKMEN